MSNNPQHFEELELVAEKAGELNDRVGKIESELGTQTKTLESAAMVLDAAIKGLGALKSQVLENDIGALQLQINDKTSHLAREIGRFESAVAEIDRRSEAGDEQLNAALRDTALGLRAAFDAKSAEITEWSARVEREIAAHSVALAAIPPVIKGADAKTFNPRGEWQAGMIVNALDVVSYNGSSFISNIDGNTDKPTRSDKFTTLAKRSGNGAGGATDFASLTGITSPSQIASGVTAWQVGDLLYANTTGTLATIHPGTSGQVLISNGSGSAPSYYTATGGAGDVNGPSSATDNALTRFDGTGGKIVQNSTVTLSDTGIFSSLVDAGGTISAQRNALAPAQGLAIVSAGATIGSTVNLGATGSTIAFTYTPKTIQAGYIFTSTDATSIIVYQTAAGSIWWLSNGSPTAQTPDGTLVANVPVACTITRDGTTCRIYVNGVLSASGADAFTLASPLTVFGTINTVGNLRLIGLYNRQLSAAEVLALYQTGAVASADICSASNTTLLGAANFVNAYGFTTFVGAVSTFSCASCVNSSLAQQNSPLSVVAGRRYLVTISGNAGVGAAYLGGGGNNQGNTAQNFASGTGGSVILTAAVTGTSYLTIFCNAGFTAATGITITALGALIAPEANALGYGTTWLDTSGNAANITLPASGVSWALPSAQNYGCTQGTLSGTTPAITFSDNEQGLDWTLTGNSTPTASGYAAGRNVNLFITGDTSTRTFTWPAWTWIGGSPASSTANKKMRIALECRGTTAASVFATYAEQS